MVALTCATCGARARMHLFAAAGPARTRGEAHAPAEEDGRAVDKVALDSLRVQWTTPNGSGVRWRRAVSTRGKRHGWTMMRLPLGIERRTRGDACPLEVRVGPLSLRELSAG